MAEPDPTWITKYADFVKPNIFSAVPIFANSNPENIATNIRIEPIVIKIIRFILL